MASLWDVDCFPSAPGVYVMRDERGRVLYVGKAKDLRTRIKNYLAKGGDKRPQVSVLISKVRDIDYIVTDTEKEALLLEASLIKEYKPRYNICLKDDKSYVSIRLDVAHSFPSITVIRRVRKDGAIYFGPYPRAVAAKLVVDFVARSFGLRTCSDYKFENRSRPCLRYDIGRCTAPCVGMIGEADYRQRVDDVVLLLEGKRDELIKKIETRMFEASRMMCYEEAAQLKELLRSLKDVVEVQNVVDFFGGDSDYIGLHTDRGKGAICVLMKRGGCVIGDYKCFFEDAGMEADMMESFLLQYYDNSVDLPDSIVVSCLPGKSDLVEGIIGERVGRAVGISRARSVEEQRLIKMALKNACEFFLSRTNRTRSWEDIADDLRRRLGLKSLPRCVDAVDVSNIAGQCTVGVVVSFVDGKPSRERYRRYKIALGTADDYLAIRQVLERRFKACTCDVPDLLLIDGGRGQLAVAEDVLRQFGIRDVPLVAIAKPKKAEARDKVFVSGRKSRVGFSASSPGLLFLMYARDEAHRFGVAYHRQLRSTNMLLSPLDAIRGIGAVRKRRLIEEFGSIDVIKDASVEEIASRVGISLKLAALIKKGLS